MRLKMIILVISLMNCSAWASDQFVEIGKKHISVPQNFQSKPSYQIALSILDVEGSADLKRIKTQIILMSEVFAACGISLKSPVIVHQIMTALDKTFADDGSNDFSDLSENISWGHLMKEYESEGVPVLLLHGTSDEAYNGDRLLAITSNLLDKEKSVQVNRLKDYPLFGIVMTRSWVNDSSAQVLSHEMGHVLFGQGHSVDAKNIMFSSPLSSEKRGATVDINLQCPLARDVIARYMTHKSL